MRTSQTAGSVAPDLLLGWRWNFNVVIADFEDSPSPGAVGCSRARLPVF